MAGESLLSDVSPWNSVGTQVFKCAATLNTPSDGTRDDGGHTSFPSKRWSSLFVAWPVLPRNSSGWLRSVMKPWWRPSSCPRHWGPPINSTIPHARSSPPDPTCPGLAPGIFLSGTGRKRVRTKQRDDVNPTYGGNWPTSRPSRHFYERRVSSQRRTSGRRSIDTGSDSHVAPVNILCIASRSRDPSSIPC